MATVMAASAIPTTVFAASIGSAHADSNLGQDSAQNAKTKYAEIVEDDSQTAVYLTVDDKNRVVSLPTSLVLAGTPNKRGEYIAKYSVGVSGDMSGDKVVTIEPDNVRVPLKSTGKNDKAAIIEQAKTEFTTDDLKNSVQTNGTITADRLTAGCWNGSFNFNIQTVKMKRFYSSLNLAVQDINQETVNTDTTVADLETADNATCGVYYSSDTYRIELYKNINNQDNLSFEKNTKLNLNEHTITFLDTNGIAFSKSFSAVNGTLNGRAARRFISSPSTNTEGTFVINNITINHEIPTTVGGASFTVDIYNKTAFVKNSNLNLSGAGNANYNVVGLCNRNTEGTFYVNHYTHVANVTNTKAFTGIQTLSNLNCKDSEINLSTTAGNLYSVYSFGKEDSITDTKITFSTDSSLAFGLFCRGTNGNAVLNNVTVNGKSNSGNIYGIAQHSDHNKIDITNSNVTVVNPTGTSSVRGLYFEGNEATVKGGTVYSSVDNAASGMGVQSLNKTSLSVLGTEIFGKEWGIQTSQDGSTTIKKCNVSSTNHTAYIIGNADIYNTNFFVANRDKYTNADIAYGLYCGGTTENKKAIVNFYNCTIGSGEDLTKNTFNGIVTQGRSSDNNYTPAEINLYDTDIYTTQRAFTYNVGIDDIPIITKFNLYGKGQIYVYNQNSKKFDIIDKETLNDEILTWKTVLKEKESTGYNVYNRGIIYGNEVGIVDETTNTLKNIRVADDANVYDYRD